jgi:hypothetical protein
VSTVSSKNSSGSVDNGGWLGSSKSRTNQKFWEKRSCNISLGLQAIYTVAYNTPPLEKLTNLQFIVCAASIMLKLEAVFQVYGFTSVKKGSEPCFKARLRLVSTEKKVKKIMCLTDFHKQEGNFFN